MYIHNSFFRYTIFFLLFIDYFIIDIVCDLCDLSHMNVFLSFFLKINKFDTPIPTFLSNAIKS